MVWFVAVALAQDGAVDSDSLDDDADQMYSDSGHEDSPVRASEAQPRRRGTGRSRSEPWWQPHPHLAVSIGPDLLVLDRFWRSQGLRGGLELELHPGLALEVGGAITLLSGPTRLTDELEANLAAPLIADIRARGAALGWLRPLVSTTGDWRMVAGVGLGVVGIVLGESDGRPPVAGPAWGLIGEARHGRFAVRTRVEGAAYLAAFPEEQIVLRQLPLWVGIDLGLRLL